MAHPSYYGDGPDIVPCKICGGPIVWVVLVSGRRMPINPAPSDEGNCCRMFHAWVVLKDVDRLSGEYSGSIYVSHFATCKGGDYAHH